VCHPPRGWIQLFVSQRRRGEDDDENQKPGTGLLLPGAAAWLRPGRRRAHRNFRATVKGQVIASSKGRPCRAPTVHAPRTSTRTKQATAVTNAEGNLCGPIPSAGSYEMTVDLSRIPEVQREPGWCLQVNETATINVSLGVGGVTEQVSVTAESPLLETSNASRGTVIDSARIAELPLQSRRSDGAHSARRPAFTYNAQASILRAVRQRCTRRLFDERRTNRNNEFLLDGAAEQREPGRQQPSPTCPPARSGAEMKISTNFVRRPVRPHCRGGRPTCHLSRARNQSFTASATTSCARKGPGRQFVSFSTRAASPKTDQYIDQYGFQRRWPDLQEQGRSSCLSARSIAKARRRPETRRRQRRR